jgi:hypothetical protein
MRSQIISLTASVAAERLAATEAASTHILPAWATYPDRPTARRIRERYSWAR